MHIQKRFYQSYGQGCAAGVIPPAKDWNMSLSDLKLSRWFNRAYNFRNVVDVVFKAFNI